MINGISTKEYLQLVSSEIANKICYDYNEMLSAKDIETIQVWYCKTIQNHKGLFIIKTIKDGFILPYFVEATYNGDREELYLDFYEKTHKQIIRNKQ